MKDAPQRSKAWHAQRVGKVTASSVGAILGNSPDRSRDDVMRAMVREALGAQSEFIGNIATEYGTNNEAGALLEYRIETMHEVDEVGFIPLEDWAGASPDGLVGDDGGVEIKCPFSLRKEGDHKPLAGQPHYYDQVQFTLFVTGREWWNFYQWSPNGTKLELVEPDIDWQADAIPRLRQFHAEYLHEVANNADEHLAPRRAVIDTPEAHRMIAELDELNEQLERAAERKRDLMDNITSMANGKDALFAGRKLTQVERAGSVAYARVVKEHAADVDLEPYRGKASRYWKLT